MRTPIRHSTAAAARGAGRHPPPASSRRTTCARASRGLATPVAFRWRRVLRTVMPLSRAEPFRDSPAPSRTAVAGPSLLPPDALRDVAKHEAHCLRAETAAPDGAVPARRTRRARSRGRGSSSPATPAGGGSEAPLTRRTRTSQGRPRAPGRADLRRMRFRKATGPLPRAGTEGRCGQEPRRPYRAAPARRHGGFRLAIVAGQGDLVARRAPSRRRAVAPARGALRPPAQERREGDGRHDDHGDVAPAPGDGGVPLCSPEQSERRARARRDGARASCFTACHMAPRPRPGTEGSSAWRRGSA
jgi:hypothetical protein